MTASAMTEREISISWFADLTGLLGKYLAVLRYELEQSGEIQTIEALIHSEITKILIRQFTPGCVVTEYLIGKLFSQGVGKDGNAFDRKFRADIAVFHPVDDPKSKSSRPMAVIELKRNGSTIDLLDDVYRLAIVSLKTKATGYFVFAGPKKHVESTIDSIGFLKTMQDTAEEKVDDDEPHKLNFSQLAGCSLYNAEDHPDSEHFYGQRMFGEENKSEADPYQVRIFAFHVEREVIATKLGQRVSLAVRSLDSSIGIVEPIPTIDG